MSARVTSGTCGVPTSAIERARSSQRQRLVVARVEQQSDRLPVRGERPACTADRLVSGTISFNACAVQVQRHRNRPHEQLAVQDFVAVPVVGELLQVVHGPDSAIRERRRMRHGHTVGSATAFAQGANIGRG